MARQTPEIVIRRSDPCGYVDRNVNRGAAAMRHGSTVFAIGLIGLLGAPGVMAQYPGYAPAGERTLRCESNDGRERHCPADTRGGVRLARQLSRSACEEGRSWGVDRAGVWVGQGCRADFLIGGGGSAYGDRRSAGRVVLCESASGRSNLCVMDTRRGVELVKQLSRSACIREHSWGSNEQGVWVSGGCRAEFRARGGGHDASRTDGPAVVGLQSLRCESVDGRQRHCPADTRGGVRLVRQLSRTACVEGRSWGHDRNGVWVQAGCRADFEVGGRGDRRWSGG